jgi:hypothetical protein
VPKSNAQLEEDRRRGLVIEQHEIIVPTVAGRYTYTIPVGSWFLDRAEDTQLDIDTGSGAGWIPQAYGPDYSHLRRSIPIKGKWK